MALSSWDIFALNQDSEPVPGYVENHNGVGIEIYKNWLHIHDEDVKQPFANEDHNRFGYGGSVMMKLEEGCVTYGGWQIHAERGPKNGVYVVATSHNMSEEELRSHHAIVGCGVYGFKNEFELYRDEIEAEGLSYHVLVNSQDVWFSHTGDTFQIQWFLDGELRTVLETPAKDPVFVGVEPKDLEFLEGVIERADLYVPREATQLMDIDLSQGLRFNPGDVYLAGEPAGTPVGEAPTPILMQALTPEREDLPEI